MTMPGQNDPDDPRNLFHRLTGAALPDGLREIMEAYAAHVAQAQELGQIDMSMQVTALHSYFDLLTTPPGPDRFTETQALYYLAKLTPGL